MALPQSKPPFFGNLGIKGVMMREPGSVPGPAVREHVPSFILSVFESLDILTTLEPGYVDWSSFYARASLYNASSVENVSSGVEGLTGRISSAIDLSSICLMQ